MFRNIEIFLMMAGFAWGGTGMAGADFLQSLLNRKNTLRSYRFEENRAVQIGGKRRSNAVLRGKGEGTVQGIADSLRPPLLAQGYFEAPQIVDTGAFTALAVILPTEAGVEGSEGTVLRNGTGEVDGWSLSLRSERGCRPLLVMGRPDARAWKLVSTLPLNVGFWNLVAISWDGETARIYVNGMLAAEGEYRGKLLPPAARLRIGNPGMIGGRFRVAYQGCAVISGALSPAQAVADGLMRGTLPETLAGRIGQAQKLSLSGNLVPAAEAWSRVIGEGGEGEAELTAWAACCRLRTLPERERAEQALELFDRGLPGTLFAGGNLRGMLVRMVREGQPFPSRFLSKFPSTLDPEFMDAPFWGIALAEAYGREGEEQRALEVYGQVLKMEGTEVDQRIKALSVLADHDFRTRNFKGASERYARIGGEEKGAFRIRCLAVLAAARVRELSGEREGALEAYRRAGTLPFMREPFRTQARLGAERMARAAEGRDAEDPEAHRERPQSLPRSSITFFVAPDGDNRNPGTLKRPFATLERARDAVNARKRHGTLPRGGATVYLRGGRYGRGETFVLTAKDSGSFGAPVVYRAWRNERPVLDGGFEERGLVPVRDPGMLSRLPEAARGRVCRVDLKAAGYGSLNGVEEYGEGRGRGRMLQLFEDGVPLTPARWPNRGWLRVEGAASDRTSLVCGGGRAGRWKGAGEMMAHGYWADGESDSALRIGVADAEGGRLAFAGEPPGALRNGQPYFVFNLLEELDEPGEWFLDRKSGVLYLWPIRHRWFGRRVIGRFGGPFVRAEAAHEIVFHGLTFEHGTGTGIEMERCINVTLSGNEICRLGGTGILARECAGVEVYGNRIHSLGGGAMQVGGGNRRNLTSGRIRIENNAVWRCGLGARGENPAIRLEGCGARIAHNELHDLPGTAMRISGNDHVVEYNLICRVLLELGGRGAVELAGDPTYRGVQIRFNYWRDMGGPERKTPCCALLLDEGVSGVSVYGNRFERSSTGGFGALQIRGGQNSQVDNNLFMGGEIGVGLTPWGVTRWARYLASPEVQKMMTGDLNFRAPPYSTRYPELADLDTLQNVDVNGVSRNLFIGVGSPLGGSAGTLECEGNRELSLCSQEVGAILAQPIYQPIPPVVEMGTYPVGRVGAPPVDP